MQKTRTVKDYIRTIVDFPHEGIMFRDVTTLFADPRGFRMAIDQMLHPYAGMEIDKVVGLEARGFILGGAVAHQLSTGFVPIRKKGKLPGPVISEEYTLEYGEAVVEIHDDAIEAGERILVVDDDEDILRVVRINLELEGFEVVTALDGQEALDSALEEPPDLVLLDLMMPEVDGFEVMETIRADKALADTRIIVITAKTLTAGERRRLSGQIELLLQKGSFLDDDLLEDILSTLQAE